MATVTAPTPAPKPNDVTSNVDRYYLVVAQTDRNLPSSSNVKVLYKSANVEDAKAYMMIKFPCGYESNYPQRMIVEVIDNTVQAECDVCTAFDPNGNRFKQCCNVGPIAGQGQSLANGFNQFWWGREEIYTMVMAATRYVNSPYGLEGWVNPNPNEPVVPCNEVAPSPTPTPQRKLIKNRKGGRVLINNDDYHLHHRHRIMQEQTCISISIFFDKYPGDTSWSIIDDLTGATAATSPVYDATMAEMEQKERVCLAAPGRYSFIINDVYEDGICCSWGSGNYTVTLLPEGDVLASGGAWTGPSETTKFALLGAPPPATTPPPTNLPTPQPSMPVSGIIFA
jgi:hypothetical protein